MIYTRNSSLTYDTSLAHTLCHKYGYGTDFETFKKEAGDKFSLLKDGTLNKPSTKLLLVNGTEDEIFPIDDYYLCLQHGGPKDARYVEYLYTTDQRLLIRVRFVVGKKHMGEPESFFIILEWFSKLLDIKIDIPQFMSTIPSKPKY